AGGSQECQCRKEYMRNIRRRVLVVEDGFSAAEAIVRTFNHPRPGALQAVRFAAERVSTLPAARKRLKRRRFDVILTGLRPNNGLDVQRIARLREEFPDIALVAVADAPRKQTTPPFRCLDPLMDAI